MKEIDVRQKIIRLLKALSEVPITQTDATRCPNCGSLVKPKIGRPDILGTPGFVIEVKVLSARETSFPFSRISEQQRRWLDFWSIEREFPGFLGLGVIRPHGEREFLEHLYLVPWRDWLEMESVVEQHQSSIPYIAGKGYKTALQEQSLDIVTMLLEYELHRESKKWIVPDVVLAQIKGEKDV